MQCSKVLTLTTVALLVGCQTSDLPTGTDVGNISAVISDGAHGGNPFFFFLRPMVPKPRNLGSAPFNPTYRPVVRICEFDAGTSNNPIPPSGNGLDECGEGDNRIFPDPDNLPPFSASLSGDHYIFHWRTVDFALETFSGGGKIYRTYVFQEGEEVLFGFADVQVEATRRDLRNVDEESFVPLLIDRTLPVKFSIKEGAWCEAVAPDDPSNCVEGTVNTAEDSEVSDDDGNGIVIPAQTNTTQTLTIALLPCTNTDESPKTDLEIDLVKVGTCFELSPSSAVQLDVSPTISSCVSEAQVIAAGLTQAQIELLKLHRREDDGVITALATGTDNCVTPLDLSRSFHPNPIVRFAQNTWRRAVDGLASVTIGRPLYANSSMFIDRFERGGNPDADDECCSQFQFALPSTIEIVPETNNQVAAVGTTVPNPPAVLVLDAEGNPVEGATVRFGNPTNNDGVVTPFPGAVLSGPLGIARATSWELVCGVNLLDAGGRGFGLNGPFVPDDDAGTASDPLPIDPQAAVTFSATGGKDDGTPGGC